MSQTTNKKKFRIAGSSACPAAVDARWSQIRRFGYTPKKGDSILSPNNLLDQELNLKPIVYNSKCLRVTI